jgi:hypothetical protein
MARRQAEIRQEVQEALPPVKLRQLCYVWHDGEYRAGRIVRISARRKQPGTWNCRIYPFAHRGKHMPPWQVCQPAHMVRTDPPECECVNCSREFYPYEMAENNICAECAQGADMPGIEAADSAAAFWADWYEDDDSGQRRSRLADQNRGV